MVTRGQLACGHDHGSCWYWPVHAGGLAALLGTNFVYVAALLACKFAKCLAACEVRRKTWAAHASVLVLFASCFGLTMFKVAAGAGPVVQQLQRQQGHCSTAGVLHNHVLLHHLFGNHVLQLLASPLPLQTSYCLVARQGRTPLITCEALLSSQ